VDEVVASKKHVIALGPMIDNHAIVHHVVLFQANDSMLGDPQPCGISVGRKWITHWAPGGGNFELPPEAGFPVDGTTHWVLQVHYNNAKGLSGQSDESGYQLCETDELRPHDAGVVAFGSVKFAIPPRAASHTVKCDYKLGPEYA